MTKGQGGGVGAQLIDATTGGAFVGTVLVYVTGANGTDPFGTQALGTVNSGVCVAEGNGFYSSTLTASESNYDVVACTFVATGAVTATVQYVTESIAAVPTPSSVLTGTGVTTALTLITDAFEELNVFQPGESIPDTDAQAGLRALNRLIGSWAQQSLTIPAQSRDVVSLVANQGTYTIGTGGDFNTIRPPNQSSLVGAALILTASSPTIEVSLSVLTDDAYRALTPKGLTSTQPVAVYYNPTFSALFGTIVLWPAPTTTANSLALYLNRPLSTCTDLTTTYAFPAGDEDALTYGLARRLAKPYGREVDEDLKDKADQALMVIKRSNVKLVAMGNYFGSPGWYDFLSDTVRGN